MKNDEFVHILTRVVNSKYGPRFLEAIHELREILEEAGISEEAAPKIEPGKPLRRRLPEDVQRKFPREPAAAQELQDGGPEAIAVLSERPPDPAEADLARMEAALKEAAARAEAVVREMKARAESPGAPAAPAQEAAPAQTPAAVIADPATAPADASLPVAEAPAQETVPAPATEPSSEFVPVGPNRLIRKSEAPPGSEAAPAVKAPRKERKDSVRSIVLAALQEGEKTMTDLQEAVRIRKGEISHLYQQTYMALKKAGIRKTAAGRFTLAPPAPGETAPDEAVAATEMETAMATATEPLANEAALQTSPVRAGPRQLNILEDLENASAQAGLSEGSGDDSPP